MHVATFIKFGKFSHVNSLMKQGELYLNTYEYFRGIDDGQVRGDRYEGASEIYRGTEGTIKSVDGRDLGAVVTNWELGTFPANDTSINLFSIFTLEPHNYPVTDEVRSFGDYAFVVSNPDEFLDRIKKQLGQQGINGCGDKVKYVPDDFKGKLDPFTKRASFRWQSEWRLKVNGGNGNPRRILLGDLSDIAFVCKSSEVNSRITVTEADLRICTSS